jgi:hypothetical protein
VERIPAFHYWDAVIPEADTMALRTPAKFIALNRRQSPADWYEFWV